MLKLKKVGILGFKSFCDRTEVQLAGEGIAAIVGPNGCGKSNIADAITWVLGEQSAKSLRGLKMEDVIFAGTRERRPTGMAEVSLTLVDPEVYDSMSSFAAAEAADVAVASSASAGDWDETQLRAETAQETEDAVADAQPGTTYEANVAGRADGEEVADPAFGNLNGGPNGSSENDVVLKVRRRKFGRAPIRAGEITVTRRLFRSGESEYLLNGKICRLRDIQDIFMGTGLGGESYAIIGQERIGQMLSSKPSDRRAIIEEAAGITRFKTKKRLAELRLESAKANLSRVNDIFEEVTRQVAVLKRQAAKAEKYGALRDEFRAKLHLVLASRLAGLDADRATTEKDVERLTAQLEERSAALGAADAEHAVGLAKSYEIDKLLREAGTRAAAAAVELERVGARATSNRDRIEDLADRLRTGGDDLSSARDAHTTLAGELEGQRRFLDTALAESKAAREAATGDQTRAGEAARAVSATEALVENARRAAIVAMGRGGAAANEIGQAEAALAGFEREQARLEAESAQARGELETLGHQRGQVKLAFESVNDRLKRLEGEIVDLRHRLEQKRLAEIQSRRAGDALRGEVATLTGRRSSLEALIREHSYSTDTVRNLFRNAAKRPGGQSSDPTGGLAPAGTLADFLEVDGRYENVVDEFLRDELNYVVVKSWDAADEGVRLLQTDVAGRATFLVHGNDAAANPAYEGGMASAATPEGVVALKDCVRVLDGFGRSLEAILPRLREGFVTPDSATARALALAHPQAFFLSPTGETFHNVTVTGGRPRTQGPLALKREVAEIGAKLSSVEASFAQNELATHALGREITELTAAIDSENHERRDAERESANAGAALRQMEGEASRIERRLSEWQGATARNKDQRGTREDLIARKREEAARHEADRASNEKQASDLAERLHELRAAREDLQATAAAANVALAGLEERRRNADANFTQTNRLFAAQTARIAQLEAQLATAVAEKARREEETAALVTQHETLTTTRHEAAAEVERLTAELAALRSSTACLDQQLRGLREETDVLRDSRSTAGTHAARLASDIEHLEATCLNDLSVEPAVLRANTNLDRLGGEALVKADADARSLKARMEAMGPVNMMALEEFTESAERHTFLDTQRKDLLDSIENTQASIKEIDDVSREKFDAAYTIINDNFSATFTKLFGGGSAFMRLTDPEAAGTPDGKGRSSEASGIDIIASPPGKKLQNVLLLSGGEKTLTALSLLVGIFQFQPAPFCVLDEVDAPLDETNVGRFARLIAEMSADTQFVIITHSKRTMEQADIMFGVTMQEPGVAKVVSVSLGGRDRGRESRPRETRSAA